MICSPENGSGCNGYVDSVVLPTDKRGIWLPCDGPIHKFPACHLPRRGSTVAGGFCFTDVCLCMTPFKGAGFTFHELIIATGLVVALVMQFLEVRQLF